MTVYETRALCLVSDISVRINYVECKLERQKYIVISDIIVTKNEIIHRILKEKRSGHYFWVKHELSYLVNSYWLMSLNRSLVVQCFINKIPFSEQNIILFICIFFIHTHTHYGYLFRSNFATWVRFQIRTIALYAPWTKHVVIGTKLILAVKTNTCVDLIDV